MKKTALLFGLSFLAVTTFSQADEKIFGELTVTDTIETQKGYKFSDATFQNTAVDISAVVLLAGRLGGQTINGGTDAGRNLTLSSTSNSTKGNLLFGTSVYDEVNNTLGIGLTPIAGTRLTLPTEDDAVTPILAFGDGNTGFYERVDNDLRVSVGGLPQFLWFGTSYRSNIGMGPSMTNRSASNVVPTFMPDLSDDNTGIGQAGADQLSLIAGGVEGARVLATGLDLQTKTILNVGAAGNDWTQNALTLAGGTNPQVLTINTTGTGIGSVSELLLLTVSSSIATSGSRVTFREGDGSGSANNMEYLLAYNASDNRMRFLSRDANGSSLDADIWRIQDGQTTIDANTTWDDNIFDKYDDVALIAASISPTAKEYDFGKGIMKRGRDVLIEVGILNKYEDGWVGYNDQRMAALLAGGIYQTRYKVDENTEEIEHLKAQIIKLTVAYELLKSRQYATINEIIKK